MVFQINEDLSIHKLKEKVWGVGGGVGGWVGEGCVSPGACVAPYEASLSLCLQ